MTQYLNRFIPLTLQLITASILTVILVNNIDSVFAHYLFFGYFLFVPVMAKEVRYVCADGRQGVGSRNGVVIASIPPAQQQ